jgi:hypothetical protein
MSFIVLIFENVPDWLPRNSSLIPNGATQYALRQHAFRPQKSPSHCWAIQAGLVEFDHVRGDGVAAGVVDVGDSAGKVTATTS